MHELSGGGRGVGTAGWAETDTRFWCVYVVGDVKAAVLQKPQEGGVPFFWAKLN
jgi:hypothetical protein